MWLGSLVLWNRREEGLPNQISYEDRSSNITITEDQGYLVATFPSPVVDLVATFPSPVVDGREPSSGATLVTCAWPPQGRAHIWVLDISCFSWYRKIKNAKSHQSQQEAQSEYHALHGNTTQPSSTTKCTTAPFAVPGKTPWFSELPSRCAGTTAAAGARLVQPQPPPTST